jgi:hypothetical protein
MDRRATILIGGGSHTATVLAEQPAIMPDLWPRSGRVGHGLDAEIDLRAEGPAANQLLRSLPRPGQRPEPARIIVHPPEPSPRRHQRCRKCHGGGTRRHHRACGWRAVGLARKRLRPLPVREVRALLREVHPIVGSDLAVRASFVVLTDPPAPGPPAPGR